MSTLTITINLDNAVFADDDGQEVARILRAYIFQIARHQSLPMSQPLRDINGNRVGTAEVTP